MTPAEFSVARAKLASELAKLDADIAAITHAHRAERVAEVRALMAEHGLTMSDIGRMSAVTGINTAARARAPVPPKYRNSEGLTWAGRGKRPTWLRTALAGGATLDSLKIVPNGTADDNLAA